MKGKGGPTFFEVLRTTFNEQKSSTSVSSTVQAETPPPQPVPVVVDPAVEQIEPPPAPPVPTPPPQPAVTQAPEPNQRVQESPPAVMVAEQKFDPDAKFLRVTHTSAVFGVLVVVMALLGSFLLGVQIGKGMANLPETQAFQKLPYSIKAAEWPFKDAAEQKEMQRSAEYFRGEFEKLGLKDVRVLALPTKYVLLVGKFADPAAARKILDDVRRYRYSTPSGYKEIFRTAELVRTE